MSTELPASVIEKLRSGTLSSYGIAERVRFWSSKGADVSEWAVNKECEHQSRGCCRLAAEIAKAPVDHAKLNAQCLSCKADPASPVILQFAKETLDRYRGKTVPTKTAPRCNNVTVKRADKALDEPSAEAKFPCVHRTKTDRTHVCRPCGGARTHTICECSLLHRECTVRASDAKDSRDGKRVEICLSCPHQEPPTVPKMDYLTTIHGNATDLAGMYQGGTCVLVCGGPSVAEMDLSPIHQRGIVIAAINNAGAALVRPHLWFSMDKMKKFHPAILLDPAITCFVHQDKLDHYLRIVNGPVSRNLNRLRACPNVFAYRVKEGDRLNPNNFMGGPFSYQFTKGDGKPKNSTMPAALRILLDLGFSRIGIVGADFHMGTVAQYAWDEEKDAVAQGSNNGLYREMNALFEAAAPGIARQGRLVANCTNGGNLTAFPRMELAEFCRLGLAEFPAFISAKGYYVDKAK